MCLLVPSFCFFVVCRFLFLFFPPFCPSFFLFLFDFVQVHVCVLAPTAACSLSGITTLSVAPRRPDQVPSLILRAKGTEFLCPLPLFPTTILAVFDPCRQSTATLALYGSILAGAVVVYLLVSMRTKFHKHPLYMRWYSVFRWGWSLFALINDILFVINMLKVALRASVDCSQLNTRAMFFPFMYYQDATTQPDPLGHLYFQTSTGELSLTEPPPSQPFSDFVQSVAIRGTAKFFRVDLNSFRGLCLGFARCTIQTTAPLVCVNAYSDDALPHRTHYVFVLCVLVLAGWKLVLESARVTLLIWSVFHRSLAPLQAHHLIDFVRSSFAGPILHVAQLDWWGAVLQHSNTVADYMLRFVMHGLLNKVPSLLMALYFFLYVQQTGLSANGVISLVTNVTSLFYVLVQACMVYRRRASHKDLTAAIPFDHFVVAADVQQIQLIGTSTLSR